MIYKQVTKLEEIEMCVYSEVNSRCLYIYMFHCVLSR